MSIEEIVKRLRIRLANRHPATYFSSVDDEAIRTSLLEYGASLTAENEAMRKALKQILGWRELRSGANEIPIQRIEDIARAALTKPVAQPVAWKLVPMIPTEKMLEIGVDEMLNAQRAGQRSYERRLAIAYHAMLAAATKEGS